MTKIIESLTKGVIITKFYFDVASGFLNMVNFILLVLALDYLRAFKFWYLLPIVTLILIVSLGYILNEYFKYTRTYQDTIWKQVPQMNQILEKLDKIDKDLDDVKLRTPTHTSLHPTHEKGELK